MNRTGNLIWSVAARALGDPSEGAASGDAHLVTPFDGGVMVAVIDGLGHGDGAAEAARVAVTVLREHAGEPVEPVLEACHSALRATRGAVMTLASLRYADSTLTWAGVGNVEAFLVRSDGAGQVSRRTPLLRGGIVGYQLPPLRALTEPLARGDTLVMATDGLRSMFVDALRREPDVDAFASDLLQRFGRPDDDALVLVARVDDDVEEG